MRGCIDFKMSGKCAFVKNVWKRVFGPHFGIILKLRSLQKNNGGVMEVEYLLYETPPLWNKACLLLEVLLGIRIYPYTSGNSQVVLCFWSSITYSFCPLGPFINDHCRLHGLSRSLLQPVTELISSSKEKTISFLEKDEGELPISS